MTGDIFPFSVGTGYRVVRDTRRGSTVPRISVLVAMYNVERYVPATLRSLASQSKLAPDSVEYIFVSDKSPDRSLDIVDKWARGRNDVVVVEAESNGGPAHARNIGLALARGEWVTAVDPDDVVSDSYFAEVLRMIDAAKGVDLALISTRVYITEDDTGRFRDTHPLGRKFRYGNRYVRLNAHPECIQLGATVFMRNDVLASRRLMYDVRCVPTFEDGALIGAYLAQFDEPVIGLASTAHYFYRKRSANDSAVQRSFSVPERYTNALRHGYLAMLETVLEVRGHVPRWASNMVLYDLAWYFKQDDSMRSAASWIDGALRDEFLELLHRILQLVPAAHIEEFYINPMSWSMRQALLLWAGAVKANARLFVWGGGESGADFSVLEGPQARKVDILVNAKEVPETDIVGRHRYSFFGTLFMVETTVRTVPGDVAVFADGMPLRTSRVVRPSWPGDVMDRSLDSLSAAVRRRSATQAEKRRERLYVRALIRGVSRGSAVAGGAVASVRNRLAGLWSRTADVDDAREAAARAMLDDPGFRAKWTGCWVLLDHIDRADDNAEHLLRYMVRERPQARVVYLLTRDSKDWDRLAREGMPLVDYDSAEAWAITAVASVVVSSDAVEGCMYPAPRSRFGASRYKFVFLQHGISCNDISRWLNAKRIDLLTAATRAEYDAFTKRESPYVLTTDEVALTGFPRFDALHRIRGARAVGRRGGSDADSVMVVMPTWRQYLKDGLEGKTGYAPSIDALLDSSFGRSWMALMRSPRLVELARREGLRVRFLLHPNMSAMLHSLDLDPLIEAIPTTQSRFQDELANAAMFVTDYSSLAFDAAYLGIPVAYYQFDEPELRSGMHCWRPGYFDFGSMGFGPTISDGGDLISWMSGVAEHDFEVADTYRERVAEAFEFWDEENSARCYNRIVALLSGGHIDSA